MPSLAVDTGSMLSVRGLRVAYGKKEVVHGIDLDVGEGEIVALLGHNGAGKTTTLRAVVGSLGRTEGTIRIDGSLAGASIADRLRRGIAYTEPRGILAGLLVQENLEVATHVLPRGTDTQGRMEYVLDLFPALKEKLRLPAGTLSGGQRQMLALGMALMISPRLLLLDEPLLGLAPRLQTAVIEAIVKIVGDQQMSVVLVEQNIRLALEASQRAYVMRAGEIAESGPSASLLAREDFWAFI